MLRIVHFISYPQRMAGANRSLYELVTHYPATLEPLVVVTAEGPVAEAYRSAGVEVEILSATGGIATYGKAAVEWSRLERLRVAVTEALPFALRLARLLLRRKPDLVHVNDPRGNALAGPVVRGLRIPLVAHLHGEWPFEGLVWRLFEALPQRILAVSDATADSLSPSVRRKARTVHNGLGDVATPGPTVPELDAARAAGRVVLCAFASLVPFKGCHHLIDALSILRERGVPIEAVWVGQTGVDEPYERWLRAKAANLIGFAGWQSDPMRFYRSADLTVLPSVRRETLQMGDRTVDVRGNEGLPMTHIEAMYFSLPVVGTRISGVPEVIDDGVTGLVVPPGDATALADAIERLARDPALRRQMGAAGRTRAAAHFSTKNQVESALSAYRELVTEEI